MFDEIILKKAAYESTLEIFRRLHSIEIKPWRQENDETIDFQRPHGVSPSFPLSSKKILKMVGTSEEISAEGQRRISVVFDEHCGEYANEHLHPLSNTTAVRSEVIGNKSISLIFDDQSSELDTSSESVSTISSRQSDGATGKRRFSLIFDDHNSSVSSKCVSMDNSMVISEEEMDVSTEGNAIQTEDIAVDIRESDAISVANTVTEHVTKHNTQNNIGDICMEEENSSNIGLRADNTSYIELRADNNSVISFRTVIDVGEDSNSDIDLEAENNNDIGEGAGNNSNIDLRAIILAPSGGVELLQSEDYLKNIETPVLINILNQLASGRHDELLPLDTNITVDDTGIADITVDDTDIVDITVDDTDITDATVNESLDVSEMEIPFDNSTSLTSLTSCNTIQPADQLSVLNETKVNPESPVLDTSEETSPRDRAHCDGHMQCHLIQELRDIKQNLSTLHEAIKYSSSEHLSCAGNDTSTCDAIVTHNDHLGSHGNQNMSAVEASQSDVSRLEEKQNGSLQNNEDLLAHKMDGISSHGNVIEVEAVKEEAVPSHKILAKFIPRKKSSVKMNYANTANTIETVEHSGKKKMELIENNCRSITESECCDDLNTSMYERNYIFETESAAARQRRNTTGNTSPPWSCTRDKSQTLRHKFGHDGEQLAVDDYRTINSKLPTVEEIKTRIIGFIELEDNNESAHNLETQLKTLQEESEYVDDNNDTSDDKTVNNGNGNNNNKNNNKNNKDNNNGLLLEQKDYANIYLKEYIFEKDLRTLEEEYLKIAQVLDALQVDIEKCVTIPTNETILENDLVSLDKPIQDTSSDLDSISSDSIMVFQNDVRDINEGLKQVVFTDSFEIVLSDIKCKPLSKQYLIREKMESISLERTIAFPVNRSHGEVKVLSDFITETNIRTVPTEGKDVAQYLSRLNENCPSTVVKDTTDENDEDVSRKYDENDGDVKNEKNTVTDKNEYIIDNDDVFWEPYDIYKTPKKEVINPPVQRLTFDNDIEEINKEMKSLCLQKDVDEDVVTLTTEELLILRQCMFNKSTTMQNAINDSYSSVEGYMGNLIKAMNVSVEKDVFDNDIQSINKEMQRLSWPPFDTVDNSDLTECSFSPLSQSSLENACAVDTYTCTCAVSDIGLSQKQNLHEHDDSRARIDIVSNCTEIDTGDGKVDETVHNADHCTPIEMTKTNNFHNDTGSTGIESNVIYTCKDIMHTDYITSESENLVSDIKYLHLEENGFASEENGDENEDLSMPNMTSELQGSDKRFNSSVNVNEARLESEEDEEDYASNICEVDNKVRSSRSSTSSITIVIDNERDNGVVAATSKLMESNTSQGEIKKKTMNGTCAGGDNNCPGRCQSSPTDSSFDTQDINIDSSLEDIIEQLLILGEPGKDPCRTHCAYKAGTEAMFIELPKSVKKNSKPKSHSTLKDAYLPNSSPYLPNNDQNQQNTEVTLELSSSGFLPDEGDIDPYMSSIQTRSPRPSPRRRNVISIEMTSSGSIPEGEEIDNYFSFEPFKLKSLGVT